MENLPEPVRGRGRARGRAIANVRVDPPRILEQARGLPSVSSSSSDTPPAASSSVSTISEGIGAVSVSTVVSGETPSSSSGSGSKEVPRGAHRGLRHETDYIKTREDGMDKCGTKGTTLHLQANYYAVKTASSWALYHYQACFSPDEDRTKIRKILFRTVAAPMNIGYIFDGTSLFTSKLLEFNGKEAEPDIPMLFKISAGEVRGVDNPMEISLRLVAKVNPGDPAYSQVYNVLVRKCLFALELEEMGRNFFDPKAAIKLPQQRLELWPGYITSMRTHERQVLLCVEVTHKVLRLDNVLHIIRGIQKAGNFGNNKAGFANAVTSELKDTIVMTSYNRKTYHVDDIDFDLTPRSTFEHKGEQISFSDYYNKRYGLDIQDLDQPLLVSRPSKRDMHRGAVTNALLIPELCQSTGLTDAMRSNFQLMKELSKHLHQGPVERAQAIDRFMKRLLNHPELQKEFQNWGLSFEEKLMQLPGRNIGKETIQFAKGSQLCDDKGDFTVAFRSQQMLSTENLVNWAIVVPQRDSTGVDNLIKTMSKVATPLNMKVSNPRDVIKLTDTKPQGYLRALDELVKKVPDLQMLFVILPNNKLDLYAAVKKRLAVDVGIPSQCFLAKNVVSKGLMSIATKVVVQMNAKLGGEPWAVKLPLKNTMFIGFDVYHGAKGSKGGSIGAMVASYSPNFGRYYSTTSVFHSTTEMSKNIRVDVTKCLNNYMELNGQLPERIFLYRDGVGEGQLKEVHAIELEQIKEGLKELYTKMNRESPKFAFIVVNKKINTRLFLMKNGRPDNPPPGTIVDDVVTLPERYDFYLISCAARQGTISPCSYHVIHDDSGLEPDRMQLITYKMCHLYFNWSGTIAVPAPCQYAHKLAFLTGMAYAGHANQKLSKLLHFL